MFGDDPTMIGTTKYGVSLMKEEPTYPSEFHEPGEPFHGDREWQDAGFYVPDESRKYPKFTVMTFNVLAQIYARPDKYPYCKLTSLKWPHRRANLLREIFSFGADVLCLQEVDNYDDWWAVRLTDGGYDSLFKKRTGRFSDGLVIAWKRDRFTLNRSADLDLNCVVQRLIDADLENLAARCTCDNVAQIVQLQAWEFGD